MKFKRLSIYPRFSLKFLTSIFNIGVRNQKGQTAIEYVLLIAAMAAIIFSLMGYLKGQILAEEGSCAAGDNSLGCSLQRISSSLGTSDPTFRFFILKR